MTAEEIIKKAEGLRLKAYPDPESPRGRKLKALKLDDPGLRGDPWTIGWGHTGPDVKEGLVITVEQAESLFQKDFSSAQSFICGVVKVSLTPNQLAALTSLVFNIGREAFSKSAVLRFLNAGDYTGAANAFLRWEYAQGHISDDLIKRRHNEVAIFQQEG